MSIDIDQALEWRGRQVVDQEGDKIGTFDEIYLDEGTNEPAWAAVKTGVFTRRRRVVPISTAEADGSHIRVPFTKDQVKSAPTIDSDGWVSERDQTAILRHYGVREPEAADPARPRSPESSDAEPHETDAPQQRLRLKRHTVTETLTRRSEYGPD
jgi:PRC-barrel domain